MLEGWHLKRLELYCRWKLHPDDFHRDSHPDEGAGPIRKTFSMQTQAWIPPLLKHPRRCFNQMNRISMHNAHFPSHERQRHQKSIEINHRNCQLPKVCESIQRGLIFGVKLGTSYATSSGKMALKADLDGLRLFAGALCGKRLLGRIGGSGFTF